MIEVKTAHEAGFNVATDAPPIWLVYRTGEPEPLIELRLLDEYYVIGWDGCTSESKLRDCRNQAVSEVKRTLGLNAQEFTRGEALIFARHNKYEKISFVIDAQTDLDRQTNGFYELLVKNIGIEICFVRFDMKDGPFPLIVLGGTIQDPNETVEFASRKMIPDAVIRFFRETSSVPVTPGECAEIKRIFTEKLPR